MSKLSDKFLYYLFEINGVLKGLLPSWLPIYNPTGDIFFLTARGNTIPAENTTIYLKER